LIFFFSFSAAINSFGLMRSSSDAPGMAEAQDGGVARSSSSNGVLAGMHVPDEQR
jgi:hypothetical protein